jgi:hypothetical protein
MATATDNSGPSNASTTGLLNRITNTYIHSDSVIQPPATPAPVGDNNASSLTWVDSLIQIDRVLSGSLLRLCYNVIDVVLLSLGLYYGTTTCSISHALAIISICILALSGLGLAFTLLFLVRNWTLRRMSLTDAASASQLSQAYRVRGFLYTFLGLYAFVSVLHMSSHQKCRQITIVKFFAFILVLCVLTHGF